MNAESSKINVTVVCPQPGMLNVLGKIRHWHVNNELGNKTIRDVSQSRGLHEALASAAENSEKGILVPIGYRSSDVVDSLTPELRRKLEIIIRPPRPGTKPELDERPSASLLEDGRHIVQVQDTLPALRKALLRIKLGAEVEVRQLRTEEDFRQYFTLRYQVWQQMGYLPPERDCRASQWELTFTDRTAYPIGAFTKDGRLIGCARLVLPLGHESHHLGMIQRLVAETGDRDLAACFRYPERLMHPYDLLESFEGFHAYFRRLVRKRIRSGEVSRVIVAPSHRGHSLSEVLVDSLIALARRQQIQVLFLACHARLRALYERCGFSPLAGLTCERFAGVNAPAIGMARKLTAPDEFTLH